MSWVFFGDADEFIYFTNISKSVVPRTTTLHTFLKQYENNFEVLSFGKIMHCPKYCFDYRQNDIQEKKSLFHQLKLRAFRLDHTYCYQDIGNKECKHC